MLNYFKGWKRKVGCVTLVMACVFTAAWVRSLYRGDLHVDVGGRIVNLFISVNGEFKWMAWNRNRAGIITETHFGLSRSFVARSFDVTRSDLINSGAEMREFTVDYRSIAIPLTLLSAWLILSKLRPTEPPESP